MNLLFDCFAGNPHFTTMFFILAGTFLAGLFYFHQADKEWDRQMTIEQEEISNIYAHLRNVSDVPDEIRMENVSPTPPPQD